MAETVEATSIRSLYKIGSILGPKWLKKAIYLIKMGLICLELGLFTENHPNLRNSTKIAIYGPNLEIMRQNMVKIAKIGGKGDFWKTTKTHLLLQKSSVWAKNHTRTAKPCYLEILMADFPFFDFSQNGCHFRPKIRFSAILNLKMAAVSRKIKKWKICH